MTYGREQLTYHNCTLEGAVASHLAELVRGTSFFARKGFLIRPISPEACLRHHGAPSPQWEKGASGSPSAQELHLAVVEVVARGDDFRLQVRQN
jgi:hypothetical protein